MRWFEEAPKWSRKKVIVEEYIKQKKQFFENNRNIFGTNSQDWKDTIPNRKRSLKVKPGKPMFSFQEVKFAVVLEKHVLLVTIPNLNVSEEYNLEEVATAAGITKQSALHHHNDPEWVLRTIWDYLINTGKFIFPAEILN